MATEAAGVLEYAAVKSLLTGNLALGIGVAIAAYGTYLWLVKQNGKAGFTLLFTSALIALTPKLLDGLKVQFCPAIVNMGGTCGGLNYDDGSGSTGTSTPTFASGNGSDAVIGTDGKAVVMPTGTNEAAAGAGNGFNFSGINAGQQQ